MGQHRVVSLLPSATEIVVQVGGAPLLCGRSHECDYPPEVVSHLPMLTSASNGHFTNSRDVHDSTTSAMVTGRGLYAIDAEQLIKLKPTVVVTQSLCSVCSIDLVTVERILCKAKLDPPPRIINLNPFSIEDVLQDMLKVGAALGLEQNSHEAAQQLQQRVHAATEMAAQLAPAKYPKVAFLEWIDPLFCGGHWTPQLIAMAGGCHPLNPPSEPGKSAQPSGVVSPEAVTALDPDIIIVSPCGLNLETAEEEAVAALADQEWWWSLRAVREGRVVAVDGNAHFNRPGPRLVDALEFLVGLLNDRPDVIPAGFPWKWLQVPNISELEKSRSAKDGATQSNGTVTTQHQSNRVPAPAPDNPKAEPSSKNGGHESVLPSRLSCAPNLQPDVEEAHAAACASGSRQYTDPVSGYQVFTEDALRARGYCCGRRCRHCPYGHQRIRPSPRLPRINCITRPTFLPWCDHAVPRSACATDVVLLAVCGGQSTQSIASRVQQIRAQGNTDKNADGFGSGCSTCIGQPGRRHVVALVAVDPYSRACWGGTSQDAAEAAGSLDSIMDSCAQLGLPIVAVPVHPQQGQQQQQDHHQQQQQEQQGGLHALNVGTYSSVIEAAARTFVGAQRRHMQQHEEVAADLRARSGTGGDNGNGGLPQQSAGSGGGCDLGVGDERWGPISGVACVGLEGGGVVELPLMRWMRGAAHSGGSTAEGGGGHGGTWEAVAARVGLPCL